MCVSRASLSTQTEIMRDTCQGQWNKMNLCDVSSFDTIHVSPIGVSIDGTYIIIQCVRWSIAWDSSSWVLMDILGRFVTAYRRGCEYNDTLHIFKLTIYLWLSSYPYADTVFRLLLLEWSQRNSTSARRWSAVNSALGKTFHLLTYFVRE